MKNGRAYTVNYNEQPKAASKAVNIYTIVNTYLNHREQILTQYGGHLTTEKIDAISRIRMRMQQLQRARTEVLAKVLLQYEAELILLLPGKTSKFYLSATKKIDTLLAYCRSITTQTQTQSYVS